MGKSKWLAAAVALAFGVVPVTAAADPIDNPDYAAFVWYNNPGAPFLTFASGFNNVPEEVDSYLAPSGPSNASYFLADIDSVGDMTYDMSLMKYYPTSISIGTALEVKVDISNVVGTSDCTNSSDGSECEVDWEITARLRFKGAGIAEGGCDTSTFSIFVTGTWDDTTSAAFTVPALSGSGHQACGGLASFLNGYWDFGTSGATLSLYKYETDTLFGGPLVGSP